MMEYKINGIYFILGVCIYTQIQVIYGNTGIKINFV